VRRDEYGRGFVSSSANQAQAVKHERSRRASFRSASSLLLFGPSSIIRKFRAAMKPLKNGNDRHGGAGTVSMRS
jgi:hypothetical protein